MCAEWSVRQRMIHFPESVPIPLLIAALFILMIYPYIGAGILLAALCAGSGHYWLAALSFVICVALHFVMKKRIKPVRGAVAPSRAGRNKTAGKKKKTHKQPEQEKDTEGKSDRAASEAADEDGSNGGS